MEKHLLIPKIKKIVMMSKIMIDPADIRKGLPQNSLPELTEDGMILSLTAQKAPLAKLDPEGTLKIDLKYNAEVIILVDRYVQVKVIDVIDDCWIGYLFGITVKGTGKEEVNGSVKGCKVVGIEGQTIIVETIGDGNLGLWKKFQEKVNQILHKN